MIGAAALITLICSGTDDARSIPLNTSVVIDMDKHVITSADIGCGHSLGEEPCSFTEVTDEHIRFKVLGTWFGEINRITGAVTVTDTDNPTATWTIYDLTCKPAKPLF